MDGSVGLQELPEIFVNQFACNLFWDELNLERVFRVLQKKNGDLIKLIDAASCAGSNKKRKRSAQA
jgi:hypothetical protein